MKIKWMRQGALAEAVSTRIEMCLLNEKFEGICVPVRCKDFLSDAYFAEAKNLSTRIHGFTFQPGTIKDWETAPLRLGLRLGGEELTATHAKNLAKLLNAFKASFGLVKVAADDAGSLAIITEPGWAKSPWRISLITMLLRQGLAYDGKEEPFAFLTHIAKNDNPLCRGDGHWVKGTLEPMESLIAGRIPARLRDKDSYDAFSDAFSCHHGGGIYASWTGKHTG